MSDAAIEAKFLANAIPTLGGERAKRGRARVVALNSLKLPPAEERLPAPAIAGWGIAGGLDR